MEMTGYGRVYSYQRISLKPQYPFALTERGQRSTKKFNTNTSRSDVDPALGFGVTLTFLTPPQLRNDPTDSFHLNPLDPPCDIFHRKKDLLNVRQLNNGNENVA